MNILTELHSFLNDENSQSLRFSFKDLTSAVNIRMGNTKYLKSNKVTWDVIINKSNLGACLFYFMEGPRYAFVLIVDSIYLPYKLEGEEFEIKNFIVLGDDPIIGESIHFQKDALTVSTIFRGYGYRMFQIYGHLYSAVKYEDRIDDQKIIDSRPKGMISQNPNCYIATLAYQDINHPKVEYLRNFRDNKLSKTIFGKKFIKIYYYYSPKIVSFLSPYKRFNKMIRKGLDLLILILKQI